ncbi:MAG: hypothetical protein IJ498_07895 [Akkermansia sp.]|nr:hypothetical protein [Akkermansia sp.]
MRAIDFACCLLLNVAHDSLTPALRLTLLCVMSGMETGEEISDFTGYSAGTCTNMLRTLEHRGLLKRVGGASEVYLTTVAGKNHVRCLLTFDRNKEK